MPVPKIRPRIICFLFLTFFSWNSFSQTPPPSPCEDISNNVAKEALDSFGNTALYKYFGKKYGSPINCSYTPATEDSPRKVSTTFRNSLKVAISDNLSTRGRFSWVEISLPKNSTRNKDLYLSTIEHFINMGLKLDWNKYKTLSDGDERILIYCDRVYKTGALGMTRFKGKELRSMEFGFFNENHCPDSLEAFKRLFNGK